MSFGFALASIHCPECDALLIISGSVSAPEYYTVKCEHCKAVIEVRRNPATGKLEYSTARPA